MRAIQEERRERKRVRVPIDPEKMQRAVAEIDHETLLRAAAFSEEMKVEEEAEEQRERIVV